MTKAKVTEDPKPLELQWWPLSRVASCRYAENAKRHDIPKLCESILTHGFRDPVGLDRSLASATAGESNADDYSIVEGNGRVEALVSLKSQGATTPRGIVASGDDWLVPVLVGNDADSVSQAVAYLFDHNNLTLGPGFLPSDVMRLYDVSVRTQLEAMAESEMPVTINHEIVKAYLESLAVIERRENPKGDPDAQVDKADELQCLWNVRRGQIWVAGIHRIMCGDSRSESDVALLLGDARISLLSTDPPYGVSYVAKARDMHALGYVHSQAAMNTEIDSDELNGDELIEFLVSALRPGINRAADQCAVYVWHQDARRREFMAALDALEVFQHQIVEWLKPGFVIGRCNYHHRFEPCFHGWPQGKRPDFLGERNQSNVWELARENDKIHPTQKPVELFAIPMRNHTRAGDICYEPFAGSGTQLVAGEIESRAVYAMELCEKYVAVCLQRLAEMNLTPQLIAS